MRGVILVGENSPKRKGVRLKSYDYSSPGAYFITMCSSNRANYFWNGELDLQKFSFESVGANCVRPMNLPLSEIGKIVYDELEIWNKTYSSVSLSSYVIMPDHIHIMLVICGDINGRPQVAPTIIRMVKQFKGAVTKKVGHPIWQKSFAEHIVRDKQDYDTKTHYIYNNPIKLYYNK